MNQRAYLVSESKSGYVCGMEVCTGKSRKAYFKNTHNKICGKRKGETVKKPGMIEDLQQKLCEAWIGQVKFCTTTRAINSYITLQKIQDKPQSKGQKLSF